MGRQTHTHTVPIHDVASLPKTYPTTCQAPRLNIQLELRKYKAETHPLTNLAVLAYSQCNDAGSPGIVQA